MNYKEALNILDETVIGDLELKIVLSNALERQIPKKVRTFIENKKRKGGYCPNCNGTVVFEKSFLRNIRPKNCCTWCGQALDWED